MIALLIHDFLNDDDDASENTAYNIMNTNKNKIINEFMRGFLTLTYDACVLDIDKFTSHIAWASYIAKLSGKSFLWYMF